MHATTRKVYLAAPLFGLTERRTNRALAQLLTQGLPGLEILLPQDFKYHGRFNAHGTFGTIFQTCVQQINHASALVALLDGCDSDSGTCFEVGYAYAKGIPILGVRTDYRDNQESGLNLMISRSCTKLIFRPAFDEDLSALAKDILKALAHLLELHAPAAKGAA